MNNNMVFRCFPCVSLILTILVWYYITALEMNLTPVHAIPAASPPEAFDFEDYRVFLNSWVSFKRQNNPRWSLRLLSRQLGLSGTGTLSNMLLGRRGLSIEMAQKLSEVMKLSDREREYFHVLVAVQSRSSRDLAKNELLRRKESIGAEKRVHQIDFETFRLISSPHYYAIREAVNLRDFREDPAWIQHRFRNSFLLTEEEIALCLRRLLDAGLLSRDENGKLVQDTPIHSTPAEFKSEATRGYHDRSSRLATSALRKVGFDRRHFTATTFGIRKSDLPRFKQKIEEFCRESLGAFDGPDAEEIYQLNMQLFPLSEEGTE